jgi:4-amino-4-deoxy-L-arabinose transferase-like glycosyltransferase
MLSGSASARGISVSVVRFAGALLAVCACFNLWQQWQNAQPWLAVAALWGDPAAQSAMLAQREGTPLALLRTADALLPPGASVLLVTPGVDVRHQEYTTFHRALYWLAPRPVWWLSPAPDDGTWEARWWTSAPLDSQSITRLAHEHNLTYVLQIGTNDLSLPGEPLTASSEGALVALSAPMDVGQPPPIEAEYAGRLWPLQTAAALLTLWLVGAVVLRWIVRPEVSRLEWIASVWVVGTGSATFGMLALNAAGLALTQAVALLSAASLAAVLLLALRRPLSPVSVLHVVSARADLRQGATDTSQQCVALLLMGAVLALTTGLVALDAFALPLHGWDAWVTWGMKARTLFLEGHIGRAVYAEPSRAVTHLDYPLMLPLAEAWLFGWLGAPDDRLSGILPFAFYAALLVQCFGALRRWAVGRLRAGLAVMILATLLPVTQAAGGAFADVPLMACAAMAAIALVDWLEQGRPAALWMAALAAALLPWLKREGWLLVFVLCAGVWLVARDRRRTAIVWGVLGLASLAFAGPWYAFIATHGIAGIDFLPLLPATLPANVGRIPSIGWHLLLNLVDSGWTFIWLAVAALAGWLFWLRRERRQMVDLLPVAALLYLTLISAAFVFSSHVPFQQHVVSAIERLTAHVAPLALLWLARRTSP